MIVTGTHVAYFFIATARSGFLPMESIWNIPPNWWLPGSFAGLDDSQLAAVRPGGEDVFLGGLNISLFQPMTGFKISSEKIL